MPAPLPPGGNVAYSAHGCLCGTAFAARNNLYRHERKCQLRAHIIRQDTLKNEIGGGSPSSTPLAFLSHLFHVSNSAPRSPPPVPALSHNNRRVINIGVGVGSGRGGSLALPLPLFRTSTSPSFSSIDGGGGYRGSHYSADEAPAAWPQSPSRVLPPIVHPHGSGAGPGFGSGPRWNIGGTISTGSIQYIDFLHYVLEQSSPDVVMMPEVLQILRNQHDGEPSGVDAQLLAAVYTVPEWRALALSLRGNQAIAMVNLIQQVSTHPVITDFYSVSILPSVLDSPQG